MDTHGFIRVPPDSTGKRIAHSVISEVTISGISNQALFLVGESVEFMTTKFVGQLSEVTWLTASTAEIHISLHEPIHANISPVMGETLEINGIPSGVVGSVGNLFYLPQSVIAGGKNNVNVLDINGEGAAYTTFVNGSPEFDAYGKLQVSQSTTLANYVHNYDTLNNLFTTVKEGSGVVTHMPNVAGVKMTVGTDAGAKVVRTSDLYHVYQPGVSQTLTFTGSLGDTGKVGVVRRAGLYDEENGMFFEMKDNAFNVVLRSKSTGSVQEIRVPSTEWNGDRMNGEGGTFNPSGILLDVTKDNLFWIDFQWFGAGSIRFGTYINGKRRVIHSMHHTNINNVSYMTTGTLPFRYEIENTGIPNSGSEFNIFCASVKTEGEFNPRRTVHSASSSREVTTQTDVPVITIRPKGTFNGMPNRGTMYMYNMMLYNASADPMLINLNRASATTGGTWLDADTAVSMAEYNADATDIVGGVTSRAVIVAPGQSITTNLDAFDEGRQGFRRKADVTIPIEQVLCARLMSGNTGGLLHVVVSWDEVRS